MAVEGIISCKDEILYTLKDCLIPFWLDRGTDEVHGGYLTEFDENGDFNGTGVKNIVTQSRMIWGFSYLLPFAQKEDKERMRLAAKQGVEFFLDKFWDKEYGGFYWLLNRDGTVKDGAKLTYGESFAIYALSQYAITYGDSKALKYAEATFDLLQKYAADTLYGGYYENIERDWTISEDGAYAGDRKSLDIHMHLLEGFTTLYKASGKHIHARKLKECWGIIKTHMINKNPCYGLNQFSLNFIPLNAIDIMRTWNAERESNETVNVPLNTTSYGHNVELSWLTDEALKLLGTRSEEDNEILISLLDHALMHGYDYECGGIFRDGVGDGDAIVLDKEWWQNWESLVGFLNGYVLTSDDKYLNAFKNLWQFVKTRFMNYDVGESRQLLDRRGEPIISNMGNAWKAIYHTGRSLFECVKRLDGIIDTKVS
jgi:mannobiose 2-epimerase